MIRAGQVVLFPFSFSSLAGAKRRPAVVLERLPGRYDDWLVCMVSSQLDQAVAGFDEIIAESDTDFERSGLKRESVVRIGRLAVVEAAFLLGALGEVDGQRRRAIRTRLSSWVAGS